MSGEQIKYFGGERPYSQVDAFIEPGDYGVNQPAGLVAVLARTSEDSPKKEGLRTLFGKAGWDVLVSSSAPHFVPEEAYQQGMKPKYIAVMKALQLHEDRDPLIRERFGLNPVEIGAGQVLAVATDIVTEMQTPLATSPYVLGKLPARNKDEVFDILKKRLVDKTSFFADAEGLSLTIWGGVAGYDLQTNRGKARGFRSQVNFEPFSEAELRLYVYGARWCEGMDEVEESFLWYRQQFGHDRDELRVLQDGVDLDVLLRVSGGVIQEHPIFRSKIRWVNGSGLGDADFNHKWAKHLRRAMGVPVEVLRFLGELSEFSTNSCAPGKLTARVKAMRGLLDGLPGSERVPVDVGCWTR